MTRGHGATLAATILMAMVSALTATAAATPDAPTAMSQEPRRPIGGDEPYATGWSFYADNDFLSFGLSGDRGYTGGFALTLSGRRAAEYPWSLDPALGWIDRATGWASLHRGAPVDVSHGWEIGMTAFTPDDIDVAARIRDDHSYAGLVFVSNTRDVRLRERRVSYLSAFSVGMLGTPLPEAVQDGLHDLAGDEEARGWGNQISDGGEPTLMWKLQRRQTHWSARSGGGTAYEIASVLGSSAGYVTQVSGGFNARWGLFGSPWWSFNPEYAEYISLGPPSPVRGRTELYLWTGVRIRHHLYNALLEGQFRDSAVTFDRESDLESTLWEASIGTTWRGPGGYHVTFALRGRERELRRGDDTTPIWGSLVIGHDY